MQRSIRPFLPLLPILGSLSACGPYLSDELTQRQAFVADVRCTQGPLEFRIPAVGARWGEGLRFGACSPRDIQGRYLVLVDGAEVQNGEYGSLRQVLGAPPPPPPPGQPSTSYQTPSQTPSLDPVMTHEAVAGPANERCVVTAADLGQGGSGVLVTPVGEGPTAPDTSAGVAGEGGTGTGGTSAVAPLVAVREVAGWAPLDREANYACLYEKGGFWFEIAWADWYNEDPAATALTAGVELLIRLWSIEPNDFEGVTFVLDQTVERPSCSDDEWAAHLVEEEQDRLEEQREGQEEADALQREAEARDAYCLAHRDDEDCWGEGGYDAYAGRLWEQQQGGGTHVATEYGTSTTPVEPPPPQPHDPEGPPPAALAEAQPPSPSTNAEWVPGYWSWGGFEWFWIAGLWRVPEADIEAGLTTHAPEAPPPLPEEDRGPAPAATAVWTVGYWQWDGAAFVWAKGSWQLPPEPEAQWRPAEWRLEATGAVLLPGGWVIRIGP